MTGAGDAEILDIMTTFIEKVGARSERLDAELAAGPAKNLPRSAGSSYAARPTKRPRASKAEMERRADGLVLLAHEHGPCSVRHLFYQATVSKVPGITKDDSGYNKTQREVLKLRRVGRIPYSLIVDSTRWARQPQTYGSIEEALDDTARLYRRDLWRSSPWRVEVWCESDSIASTIAEVTYRWAVPLMVTRGYSSETFAYNAGEAWAETPDRQPVVLYIGDHDPHGLSIEDKLQESLGHFTADTVDSVIWSRLGVTWEQVEELDLPGTRPKKNYGFPRAVEAEALPPRLLGNLVDTAISEYVDDHELDVLLTAEAEERDWLRRLVDRELRA